MAEFFARLRCAAAFIKVAYWVIFRPAIAAQTLREFKSDASCECNKESCSKIDK